MVRPRAARGVATPRLVDARPADLPALLELEEACYPPGQAYGREEYRYALEVANSVNLKLAGSPLEAFGGAFLHDGRRTGNVYTVNVHPRARGRGLGRRLVEGLEARMVEAGMARSVLEVNVANEPAIRLYESLGYERVERLRNYYQNYAERDAFRYAKPLVRRTLKTR